MAFQHKAALALIAILSVATAATAVADCSSILTRSFEEIPANDPIHSEILATQGLYANLKGDQQTLATSRTCDFARADAVLAVDASTLEFARAQKRFQQCTKKHRVSRCQSQKRVMTRAKKVLINAKQKLTAVGSCGSSDALLSSIADLQAQIRNKRDVIQALSEQSCTRNVVDFGSFGIAVFG